MKRFVKIVNNVVSDVIEISDTTFENTDYVEKYLNEYTLTNENNVSKGWELIDNVLYPKKYHESWSYVDGKWTPPIAMPEDGKPYTWNEETQTWDLVAG